MKAPSIKQSQRVFLVGPWTMMGLLPEMEGDILAAILAVLRESKIATVPFDRMDAAAGLTSAEKRWAWCAALAEEQGWEWVAILPPRSMSGEVDFWQRQAA